MEAKASIYALRALNSNKVRYIGSTVQKPEKRVARHYEDAVKGRHVNPALAQFLLDTKFQVDVIATCEIGLEKQVENEWIKFYLQRKHPLFNLVVPNLN